MGKKTRKERKNAHEDEEENTNMLKSQINQRRAKNLLPNIATKKSEKDVLPGKSIMDNRQETAYTRNRRNWCEFAIGSRPSTLRDKISFNSRKRLASGGGRFHKPDTEAKLQRESTSRSTLDWRNSILLYPRKKPTTSGRGGQKCRDHRSKKKRKKFAS